MTLLRNQEHQRKKAVTCTDASLPFRNFRIKNRLQITFWKHPTGFLRTHPQGFNLMAEEAADFRASPGERREGGEAPAAAEAPEGAECGGGVSSGSTGVLSLSSCSQEQLLDEHLDECPLCLLSQPRCHFPRLASCSHRTCSDCLRQYLRIEISESRVGIACPQCNETLAPMDIRAIVDDQALLERFEEYQLRRFLAADPDTRWCPAPDCR